MAAVTSNITPNAGAAGSRRPSELIETIAVTNASATTTVSRALQVPAFAGAATFVLDITIAGTTPLFDLAFYGVVPAVVVGGTRYGATFDSTTDIFQFPTNAAITQLTTDGSTPTVTIDIGPNVPVDSSGSATANSGYSFPCVHLPQWLIYIYTYDGTTTDEDYNGTLSVNWYK